VLLTNAVGGIKRSYNPGDLVIVRDSINHYPSANPMFGLGHELFGPYFLDMTNLYDVGLREIAAKKANETRIDLRLGGVLNFFPGPQIETPAEILAMERNGCDMTGMSLVPEAMAAYHMGRRNGTQKPVKVFGLSCIANRAAGTGDGKSAFSHTDEVLPTVRRAAERAKPFFEAFIAAVP
jgi:purine-nucleoside phosphorylase